MSDSSRRLCRLGSSAFAVAQGPTLDSVLITLQNDGVIQYCTSNKETTATWTIGGSNLSFLSAAVFNTLSQLYFAAVSKAGSTSHQILSWSPSAPAMTLDHLATACHLPKSAHSIHPAACNPRAASDEAHVEGLQAESSTSGRSENRGVFVVFTDGRVALDGYYSNGKHGRCMGPDSSKVEAAASHQGSLLVVSVDADLRHSLRLYGLQEGQLQIRTTLEVEVPAQARIVSASLKESSVSLLSSEGTVQCYSCVEGADSSLHLNLQTTRKLSGFTATLPPRTPQVKNGKKLVEKLAKKRKSEALVSPVEQQQVVQSTSSNLVAAASWMSDDGGEKKRLRLNLLDSVYGTVQSVGDIMAIDDMTLSKCPTLQVVCLDGESRQLAILAGGVLTLAPLPETPPSMASMVGALSLEGKTSLQLAAKAALHSDECLRLRPPLQSQPHVRPSWLVTAETLEPLSPEALLEVAVPLEPRESDGASTAGQVDEEEMSALIDEIHSQKGSGQSEAIQLAERLLHGEGEHSPKLKALPHSSYSHLLLSLAEKDCWGAFEMLHSRRGLHSLSQAPGLLVHLAKADQHELIASILDKGKDVAPKDLFLSLEHLLSGDRPADASWHASLKALGSAAGDQDQNVEASREAANSACLTESFTPKEAALHAFVASPIDTVSLMLVLKHLGAQHTTLLFQYLLSWLRQMSEPFVSLKGRSIAGKTCKPSIGQVSQWCAAIIDIHLVGLASRPDCKQLAMEMQDAVIKHLQGVAELGNLRGAVEHIQKSEPLPTDSIESSSYVVELLDLSITHL